MALKRIVYRSVSFPGKVRRSNIAVQTTAPPVVTVRNYYSGGTANIQRLTRGIGWVSVWVIFFLG